MRHLFEDLAPFCIGEVVRVEAARRRLPAGNVDFGGGSVRSEFEAGGHGRPARLHDLRHAHASYAVMNGESLHVAGRLSGHRRAGTTSRCVHLETVTPGEAAGARDATYLFDDG